MEKYEAIMRELLPPKVKSDPSSQPWKLIGRDAYLRGEHGTFKLEIWDGGTYEAFVGLEGTYVSHVGGKVDCIVFRFADLLEPDYAPAAARRAESVESVRRTVPHVRIDRDGDWYIVRPKSLKPLHEEIRAWVAVWNRRT